MFEPYVFQVYLPCAPAAAFFRRGLFPNRIFVYKKRREQKKNIYRG